MPTISTEPAGAVHAHAPSRAKVSATPIVPNRAQVMIRFAGSRTTISQASGPQDKLQPRVARLLLGNQWTTVPVPTSRGKGSPRTHHRLLEGRPESGAGQRA